MSIINENKKHALLSASGASRWLACPPSARLEEQFPEVSSEYAEEGSLAHTIAERKLKKTFIDTINASDYDASIEVLKSHELYSPEMDGYTDMYLNYIAQIMYGYPSRPYIVVEGKLDFSEYVPEGYGTADCIIIFSNIMHVSDFKYGKGVPVSAENNPQMMLYALGAYQKYSLVYPITKIKMAIIQPRLDEISEWELTVTDLLQWADGIKPIAQMAYEGKGEFRPGEHCRFCRAKAKCRARAEHNLELEGFRKALPPLISNAEVGEYLSRAQDLVKWIKDLEAYALEAILKGEDVPGWKVVEGRSNRVITDIEAAFERLKANGYPEEMLYERKPITLTAIEKLVGGKKKFEELLADYVEKPQGKPTLVPESDKREPFQKVSVESDFGDVIKGGI